MRVAQRRRMPSRDKLGEIAYAARHIKYQSHLIFTYKP